MFPDLEPTLAGLEKNCPHFSEMWTSFLGVVLVFVIQVRREPDRDKEGEGVFGAEATANRSRVTCFAHPDKATPSSELYPPLDEGDGVEESRGRLLVLADGGGPGVINPDLTLS